MSPKNAEEMEELLGRSDDELGEALEEAHKELFTVRLQLSTRQQPNTSLAKNSRRRIARIKTILRQRQLAAFYEDAAQGGA